MEERRKARVGTVSGLALLAGGTAMAASVGGEVHSAFATLLLGALTLGLGHSLVDEIKRQARRGTQRWSREDTTNAVLLGIWAEAALVMSILVLDTLPTRAVGLALAVAYAASCGYFVTERRREIAAHTVVAAPVETVADEPGPAPTAGHGPVMPPQATGHRPAVASGRQHHDNRRHRDATIRLDRELRRG